MGKKKQKKSQGSILLDETPEEIMLRRSQQLLSPKDYEALLTELQQPLRSALRLNPLKIHDLPSQYSQRLSHQYQWQIDAIPYCDHAWWINDGDIPVGQTWEHRLGNYYVQDASSMLPVELFDFSSAGTTPLILDMAASPGGKTTHLISKTNDKGLVIANDASKDRITSLRLVLQTWGSVNHAITQFPGEKIGTWFPETFDFVLLDAPCSMQNLRSTEARPMRTISMREEQSLALRQKKLLESALRSAKVGGQIVYATCTLMPEEDEAVLDWLLQQYPDSVRIDDMQSYLPQPAPALLADENHQFNPEVSKAIRVWPHRMSSSGFFTARITKTGSILQKIANPPQFDITRTQFQQLEVDALDSLVESFKYQFDMSIEPLLSEYNLTLWRFNQQILAFPQRYFDLFAGLPVRSLGLPVALSGPEQWQPDHQWVSRFFSYFIPQSQLCPMEYTESWKKGADIEYHLPSTEYGKHIIFRDQYNEFLGIGRLQEGRLKNMLPKRMVL